MEIVERKHRVDYSYDRIPTLRRFTLSDKRIRGVIGPFGSGKSSACLWDLIRNGTQTQRPGRDGIRRTRFSIVRNTYTQLKDTTIKTVLDWFPSPMFGQYKIADHDYIMTGFKDCRIELMFRALDRPEHVSNLLSLELTGVWINEAREVPKAIIDALDGRIDRYPSMRDGGATQCGIIMDTNPPDDDSWWYKYFEDDLPDNAAIFKQPSGLSKEAENLPTWDEYNEFIERYERGEESNPLGLKPDYYTNLVKGKTQEFIKVYVHGQYGFVKEGKAVYESTWNDTIHMAKKTIAPIRGKELILGFDFGLSPTVVIGQITPMGFLNILREVISDGIGIERFTQDQLKPLLATEFNGYPVVAVGDPAGNQRVQTDEKTCFDILRAEGFRIIPARTNSLVARIGAVEGFLGRLTNGRPTFQLDPSCKILRKGFNNKYYYRRVQVSGDRYVEEPFKNSFAHGQDCLQYLALYVSEGVRTAQRQVKVIPRRFQPASHVGY